MKLRLKAVNGLPWPRSQNHGPIMWCSPSLCYVHSFFWLSSMRSFGLRREQGAQVGIGKQGRSKVRECKPCGDSSSGNHRKMSDHGSRVRGMPQGEEAERGLPEETWMGDGEYGTVMDGEKSVWGHQPVPGSQLLRPLEFPVRRVAEVSLLMSPR